MSLNENKFLGENFLLHSETAKKLYHDYAEQMPIFDYHCHLNPEDIAANRKFNNLTEIWLSGDHYKWRAMRTNGISEEFCTGDADDYDKFAAWAATVPYTIGNPLYHWTHLELKNPFGIKNMVLNSETAKEIWDKCSQLLKTDEYRVHGILKKMNVKVICTTDDPADSLSFHKAINENPAINITVLPTFRPDKATAVEQRSLYRSYIERLSAVSQTEIIRYQDLLDALEKRHDYFHKAGCRISDHALEVPYYDKVPESEVSRIFSDIINDISVSNEKVIRFKTAVLLFIGRLNAAKGWTQQIHIGALRNNNKRMLKILGPDTGFDSITDGNIALPLSCYLDDLNSTEELPKTILYTLNPAYNDLIATMIGNFQGGGIPGKIQFGSGWWFNDQKDGMLKQMTSLANLGLLSLFVGMLTDSRSFLSYPRHEYFRRILCNLIGSWVEDGEAPNDLNLLGKMVQDISYNNAVNYFGITPQD